VTIPGVSGLTVDSIVLAPPYERVVNTFGVWNSASLSRAPAEMSVDAFSSCGYV
jgi:hypothetical protein